LLPIPNTPTATWLPTADVQEYFSKAAGKSLKPLFDLYLTINKLEVQRKRPAPGDKYLIQLQKLIMPLPLDVTTDRGYQTIRVPVDRKRYPGGTLTVKPQTGTMPGI
jgi:hypothetical protein